MVPVRALRPLKQVLMKVVPLFGGAAGWFWISNVTILGNAMFALVKEMNNYHIYVYIDSVGVCLYMLPNFFDFICTYCIILIMCV